MRRGIHARRMIIAGSLAVLVLLAWSGSWVWPSSAWCGRATPAAPPAGSTGPHGRWMKTWVLAARGELWLCYQAHTLPNAQMGEPKTGWSWGHPAHGFAHASLTRAEARRFYSFDADRFLGLGATYWSGHLRYNPDAYYLTMQLSIPAWGVLLPLLLLLAHDLRAARRFWANPPGCRVCGYDLRAHAAGAKCPECGSPVPGDTMPQVASAASASPAVGPTGTSD